MKFYETPCGFTRWGRRIRSRSNCCPQETGSRTCIPYQVEGISDLRQLMGISEKFKTRTRRPFDLQGESSAIMDTVTALLILIAFLCFIIALLFTLLAFTWISARNYENRIRAARVQLRLNLNPWPVNIETLDLPIQDPSPFPEYHLRCPPTPTYPPPPLP